MTTPMTTRTKPKPRRKMTTMKTMMSSQTKTRLHPLERDGHSTKGEGD